MSLVTRMRCSKCGKEYDPASMPVMCDKDDLGRLDISYDYEGAKETLTKGDLASRPRDVWRWAELLPARAELAPRLGEGGTPLIHARRLGEELGMDGLYLKDETRNPTGSFKDRSMAVSVAKAVEKKVKTVTTASSGNAAASLSAYAAAAGLRAVAFVLDSASDAKVAQLTLFGAKVIKVRGIERGEDPTVSMMREAVRRKGWYPSPSFGPFNPYQMEGPKTISFELAEAFGWRPYDWVLAPTGSSCLAAGLWKGIRDLKELGLAEEYPRLVPVQPEGNSALVRALKAGVPASEVKAEPHPHTIASGLEDPYPWDADSSMEGVAKTKGVGESVTDDEILGAVKDLARLEGVFAEPSGAAGVAGLRKLLKEGIIDRSDRVAVLVTGSGLKDIDSIRKLVGPVPTVDPSLAALDRVLA
ncbi:MAG TPA: threonine synthase [Conexivisphaerales archaeon]|nr:threonine synthase [Conexivisphaerales archaeon]